MTIFTKTRVLITVLTYPLPSNSYKELVCTAGITEEGEWVRLYPISLRYLPKHQQFRKYQWIEVALAKKGQGNDNRLESRKPQLETISIYGEPLSTKNDWAARRLIIDTMPEYTVMKLRELYDQEKRSLGIVKPIEIIDLKVEQRSDRRWKPQQQAILNQFDLFSGKPKQLIKIPYKFSYIFRCKDTGDRPHSAMIEDWELGVLYLKEVIRLGSEEMAIQSVKKKYLEEMWRSDKDSRLFMGTTFPYNSWVVLGVFWPPHKSNMTQLKLF